jgi:signal transduction histidine kinase
MLDYYHAPALILSLLLLPAFGYLYHRFRDTRTLLWFLGFCFALISMFLLYSTGAWNLAAYVHPWLVACGQTSLLISTAMFLGSLSPVTFRVGRRSILFVIPYTITLVLASIILYGVFHGVSPHGPASLVFPVLAVIALLIAILWNLPKNSLPSWLGITICLLMGIPILWACILVGAAWALVFVESANLAMTAILIISVSRRFSPGVVLSVLGFTAWSLTVLEYFPAISGNPVLDLNLIHVIVFGKVVAALGMILLALEDQLAVNEAAQERERRARIELEAYTNIILSRRRVEDFDRQGAEICQTVVTHSRFSQAALLLESDGHYHLAGAAGLDPAVIVGLTSLALRIPASEFLSPGSAPSAVERSLTLRLDFTPWLHPGDDLARLRFTSVLAVPMSGRVATEGALLLGGIRPIRGHRAHRLEESLRPDDLLPIEMLTSRLQATRSQTMMLEKLIDSEKFAGLGQLADNVAQQLNNPLTVILGYASLLEEARNLNSQERKGVESILSEARRMRSTLESLSRVSRPHGAQMSAVSVSELLADMEELHRPDFLQRSIEFQLRIAPSLPRVLSNAQQLRQAVLHCLQYAMEAVEKQPRGHGADEPKTIRLEASSEGKLVQILISHSGPGFLHPERAFDPFTPAQTNGETTGLGLSLCATILRDHNGRATAVNLEPRGAAIILELQAA